MRLTTATTALVLVCFVEAARGDVVFSDGFEGGVSGINCSPPELELETRPDIFRFVGGTFIRQRCDERDACDYEDWLGPWPGHSGTYLLELPPESVASFEVQITPGAVRLVNDETPGSFSSFATLSRCPYGLHIPAAEFCAVGGLRSWLLSIGTDPSQSLCAVPPGTYYLVIAHPESARSEVLVGVLR
jgi:hypothetical protein